jgi:hypothetical protein
MINVERSEKLIAVSAEIGDKEGTYEQKNNGDIGSQTVYVGNHIKMKGKVQEKIKNEQQEKVIFDD